MSHLRLPVTGLMATLLASVCLGNVFNDSTWFLPAVFGAVIVVAACESARRLRVPAPLVLVVGVAAVVVYATARYAGDVALLHVLPNSEALHWATEPYGPDGMYGHYLTYLLVALPLGWLALSSIFGKHQGPRSQAV